MNQDKHASIVRSAAHRLLDEYMDALVAFRADCDRAGKYDHGSLNLNTAIRRHAAVESLVHVHAGVMNGHDAGALLRKCISRECEPSCRAVSAGEFLQAVLNEIEAVKME
jgi:hypothetical protein